MRPELLWPATAAAGVPRPVVLDTNIVLDLLVFADPATQPLNHLLASAALDWIATAAMRQELARVLTYPQVQPRLAFHGLQAQAVLDTFDARARQVCTPAARAEYVCKDADDQKFIDLAAAHAAVLLSKDKAVLCMRKRLESLGVQARAAIVFEAPIGSTA